MADVVMPRLSDTMEEGTILRWLKRDGDEVRRGEELVEIETDKASMTYESDHDGVLELVAGEGDTLPIGDVIARVAVPSADGGAAPAAARSARAAPAAAGSRADDAPAPVESKPARVEPTRVEGASLESGGERVKASPLARRVARETGVRLEVLSGSGPGGRIVKADVEAAITRPGGASAAPPLPGGDRERSAGAPTVAGVLGARGESSDYELSRTQQLIARRMAESKATIPHFTLEAEIDMEACAALRSELARHLQRADAQQAHNAAVPTYNDMVVKASALALRDHVRVNGSYRDGHIELHSRVNVGVAVAVESEDPLRGALVVPTVFDADVKSLGEIARESRTLAERVRAGTITPPELSGGTFTVSNLGMYGVRNFAAIINAPQAAILSVGSLEERPIVRERQIVAHRTMAVTVACDHRMLYGADAARFLARVRELLEAPSALLL
jgi:pyruvate dehydrogenase E2 component (dihydrolipoamide acetyltransferase)